MSHMSEMASTPKTYPLGYPKNHSLLLARTTVHKFCLCKVKRIKLFIKVILCKVSIIFKRWLINILVFLFLVSNSFANCLSNNDSS